MSELEFGNYQINTFLSSDPSVTPTDEEEKVEVHQLGSPISAIPRIEKPTATKIEKMPERKDPRKRKDLITVFVLGHFGLESKSWPT